MCILCVFTGEEVFQFEFHLLLWRRMLAFGRGLRVVVLLLLLLIGLLLHWGLLIAPWRLRMRVAAGDKRGACAQGGVCVCEPYLRLAILLLLWRDAALRASVGGVVCGGGGGQRVKGC